MSIDLLYLCHGRLEFTQATLPNLIEQTEWSLVNEFVIYNDGSEDDGATARYLKSVVAEHPGLAIVRTTKIGSPVGVMSHFLHRCRADMFAKIDNDIVVPDLWLPRLAEVMEFYPDLELLGMEPGMSGVQPNDDGISGYKPATHIGGVGLMRRRAFQRLPELMWNGRFGFTEWQHQHTPERGWLLPDLRMFSLDFLPIEPWRSLTEKYMKVPGLQREWPKYDPAMHHYWDWFVK